MINTRLLRSKMLLADVSTETFAASQGWSMSTAYRKINGAVAFTVKEMQKAITILNLDMETAQAIFFTADFS